MTGIYFYIKSNKSFSTLMHKNLWTDCERPQFLPESLRSKGPGDFLSDKQGTRW